VIQAIAFYALSFIAVAAGFLVISARNPVHSVLFLILAFFTSAGLFLLLGAEFLALILVVVYVGAVAVLFLFVVMMLDIDFVALRQGFLQYLPIGALVGLILLTELILVLGAYFAPVPEAAFTGRVPVPALDQATNTEALAQILYTNYIYFFQAAGIILLIAMIGAIVLTLRHREGVKRQDVAAQVGRRPEEAVEMKKVKPGQGI
jgi:NADH-quinone oxidoreductase subunit J